MAAAARTRAGVLLALAAFHFCCPQAAADVWTRIGPEQEIERLMQLEAQLWAVGTSWPLVNVKNLAATSLDLPEGKWSITAGTIFNRNTIFGTNDGILQLSQQKLIDLPGTALLQREEVMALLQWGSALYVGTKSGLFRFDGTQTERLLTKHVVTIVKAGSDAGEHLLVGTSTGATRIQRDGSASEVSAAGSGEVYLIVPTHGGAFFVRRWGTFQPILYLSEDGEVFQGQKEFGSSWVEREDDSQITKPEPYETYYICQHSRSVQKAELEPNALPRLSSLALRGPQSPEDPYYSKVCASFNGVHSESSNLWLLTNCGLFRFQDEAFRCHPSGSCSSSPRLTIRQIQRFDTHLFAASSVGLLVLRDDIRIEGELSGLRIASWILAWTPQIGVSDAAYVGSDRDWEWSKLGMTEDLKASFQVGRKEIRNPPQGFAPWKRAKLPLTNILSLVQLTLTDELGNTVKVDSAKVVYLSPWLILALAYLLLPAIICLLALRFRLFLRILEAIHFVRFVLVTTAFAHSGWWSRALVRRYYSRALPGRMPSTPCTTAVLPEILAPTQSLGIIVESKQVYSCGLTLAYTVACESRGASVIPILVYPPSAPLEDWRAFLRSSVSTELHTDGLIRGKALRDTLSESDALIPLIAFSSGDGPVARSLDEALVAGRVRRFLCVTDDLLIEEDLPNLRWPNSRRSVKPV